MTFVDLLEALGVEYRLPGQHEHARPGWIQVDCFACGQIGHFRLGINTSFGHSNCWACGRINLTQALHELTREPYGKIKELLGKLDRVRVDDLPTTPTGKLVLPVGLEPLLPPHRRYLEQRGLDPDEMVKLWGLQGIGLHPTLAWRVFIPITLHGKVVSWTTRAISNRARLRYVTASKEQEAVSSKSLLFGGDYARHAIIIVEGPFDVFKIGPGAVGTLGTSLVQAQVLQMSKYPVRTVCFDAEPNAQARARALCDSLSVYPGITRNVCLEAADPGAAGKREIHELRKRFLE